MSDSDDEELKATRKLKGLDKDKIEVGEYVISKNRLVLGQVIEIKSNTELIIRTLLRDGFRHEIPIAIDNIKHSTGKIDLIEVGDYVNGHLVKAVYLEGTNKYIKLDNSYSVENNFVGVRTYTEDIKSIVTKEIIRANEYRIK